LGINPAEGSKRPTEPLGTQAGVQKNKMQDSFITQFTLDSRFTKTEKEECPSNLVINNCTMTDTSAGDATYTGVTKVMVCGVQPMDCKYDKPLNFEGIQCVPNANGVVKDGKLGTQTITRKIVQQDFGGAKCETPGTDGLIHSTQPCDPPKINCTLSEWKDIGKRDAQCGVGSITQARNIDVTAKYGGTCGPYNDRGETILTQVVNYDTGVPCPTNAPTLSPAPSTKPLPTTPSPTVPSASSSSSSTSSSIPASSSNTMMYAAAVGVVVIGIGIYFYLSKKAK
jgi:hypothetical protein